MLGQNATWLAALLVIACAWLWTFGRVDHLAADRITQGKTRNSPMDMPIWYRVPLERGQRYQEIGPLRHMAGQEISGKKRKAAAVRGY